MAIFAEPKLVNYENLIESIRKFIELANLNPVGRDNNRKKLYGNIYSGLHYSSDLVKLLNNEYMNERPLKASEVTTISPFGWDYILQDDACTFVYRGQEPSQALDDLVKGPTAIDCGMFTQLSLWFGIRYMLGNERFNKCFGRSPFFITQFVYNKIENSSKPFHGNPLYSFLVKKDKAVKPFVTITRLYEKSHLPNPRGEDRGVH